MFKRLTENTNNIGTPDMKYYAFDWDDNIMIMSTKIMVVDENGEEIGMSTEDFSKYRTIIGKEPFEYEGHTIEGFSELPFRYFKEDGEKQFIVDVMIGKPGPSWSDFVESINGGSIFSIITARGHSPEILKQACYNLIISNKNGIDSDELVNNLVKYRELTGEEIGGKKEMIKEYLDICKFYPVTYGMGSAVNPEEGKVRALKEFISYIKRVSKIIHKKAYLKYKISNRFIPQIGFSDDDIKNIDIIKKHFEKEPILKTYLTSGGIKRKY